jgi:IstB-like ATP binding protein
VPAAGIIVLASAAPCAAQQVQGHPAMTTATALLAQLVHAEATDRATRSIRYQMHVARFPVHRDLAGFDFDQAKVDRRQITGFATTTFTEQAENLVLIVGGAFRVVSVIQPGQKLTERGRCRDPRLFRLRLDNWVAPCCSPLEF